MLGRKFSISREDIARLLTFALPQGQNKTKQNITNQNKPPPKQKRLCRSIALSGFKVEHLWYKALVTNTHTLY